MPITLQKFAQKLKDMQGIAAKQVRDRVLITAAIAMEGAMKHRIFDNGLATDETSINNQYSSKPRKFVRDDFAKPSAFSPNTTAKRKGVTVPAMQLERGYEQFRQIQGRQTNFVDLRLSGSLMFSIKTVQQDEQVIIAITSQERSQIARALEDLYGIDIFLPSRSDKAEFQDAILKEIKYLLNVSNRG